MTEARAQSTSTTGDRSGTIVTGSLSPELVAMRQQAHEHLTATLNNPQTRVLESFASRGGFPFDIALATNVAFLIEGINPAVRKILETTGGELVWTGSAPEFKSGALVYSAEGLTYLGMDGNERRLLGQAFAQEKKFIWTPNGEVDLKLMQEALKAEDPAMIGFSQISLSGLVSGAELLVGPVNGYHTMSGVVSGGGGSHISYLRVSHLIRNPQPSVVPPLVI